MLWSIIAHFFKVWKDISFSQISVKVSGTNFNQSKGTSEETDISEQKRVGTTMWEWLVYWCTGIPDHNDHHFRPFCDMRAKL